MAEIPFDSKLTHHILRPTGQALDVFFKPSSVAVIGASEEPGSVGRTLLWNLLSTPFGGTVYPVNPKRRSVLGLRAYRNLAEIPDHIDLAVIATPARTIPGIVKECNEARVEGAIIISAGFKEIGADGVALENQIKEQLKDSPMRVIGPNCLGVMAPRSGLNATFAADAARPGNVGFISQSGALLTAILDLSLRENIGFSAFVSMGSMLDVGWGDLIDYLSEDPHTSSIVVYMESIGDARSFMSAAREAALTKPIIVIKPGRTDEAAKAAASHTGSLTGSDAVFEAVFQRCGVLRVNRISELFHMANILSKQPRPKGPRLTIVTNAGGPGVLATDALISLGGQLTKLSPKTMQQLNEILPPAWSHGNPVDILGDAGAERYAKAVEIAAKDPNSDGLLVVLTPTAMTDPTQIAERLRPYAKGQKPILASWMGGSRVAAGWAILNQAGIPSFPYPDNAARAFCSMWRYSYNLRAIYETPAPTSRADSDSQYTQAARIVHEAFQAGRTLLTEYESKKLLAVYDIPTVDTHLAATADEAVAKADTIGYPVVVKLHSEELTHKTDVGGVKLNLADADAVRAAFHEIKTTVAERSKAEYFDGVTVQPMIKLDGYELILGSTIDPQFGPVLLFGTGGQLVEVFEDRSLGLPPLNTTLARRMMERTRIYKALQGVRGRKAVDLAALEQMIVHFGRLAAEHPRIKEIDINPLLASEERMIALDARVILHGRDVPPKNLPRPVIRSYPTHYIRKWNLENGVEVTIRPIRSDDEPLIVKFHETLSERSVYQRYLHSMKLSQRIVHDRLSRICCIDYAREMALVAEIRDADGNPSIVGVGRLIKEHAIPEAEFALLITDAYQRQGLGTQILSLLLEVAHHEEYKRITADILPENRGMLRVCEKLGFRLRHHADHRIVKATFDV